MIVATSKVEILRRVRVAMRSEPRLGARFKPDHLELDDEWALTVLSDQC